jgi:Ca2+-transporting ATPase
MSFFLLLILFFATIQSDMQKEILWHLLKPKEIQEKLSADFKNGLSEEEAEKRLKKYGKNLFTKEENFYYLRLFWDQIKSPLVFILIIAGIITFFLKEFTNTIVIFIVVAVNTIVGVFQEGRASKALKKLKSSQKKVATVIREGRQKIIDAENLVPGDIIILRPGDFIPADARLIEEKNLEVNESALTGEWMAVQKTANVGVLSDAQITERKNMLWMGTLIVEGWASAIVTATGEQTEMGKIAEMVTEEKTSVTPLQKGISRLARFLGIITVSILAVIFIFGILRGESFTEMLLVSVAVAVAAIPSGLPIAVTVVLAIGMSRILEKNGLIKNLNAAETLGSTNIILTDKTGTLTSGDMQVSKIITLLSEKEEFKKKEHKDRLQVLQMAVMASQAFIENSEEKLKSWIVRGRAVDKAVLTAGIESGLNIKELFTKNKKIDFVPFDSERRFSAVMFDTGGKKKRIYVLGSPELILSFSNKIYKEGKEAAFREADRNLLDDHYRKETALGTRVLGIAYKDCVLEKFPTRKEEKGMDEEKENPYQDMVFGGFVGFHDPLREDVTESIKIAAEANIRPIMMTGDHKTTAKKIAGEAGLLTDSGLILTGEDVAVMDEKKLADAIDGVDVYARVLPAQKLAILRAWQSKGVVVAMTGDGVNDAPALQHADIGIALGSGTDVAKEASDLVLLNNSFSTIVSAIEEGRRILDNLRKIIAYLLSTAFSEIVIVGVAVIAGMPLPLLPAQILWTNIIEESFMNFAFAFEPKEKDLMKRDPKTQSSKNILTKELKGMVSAIVGVTGVSLIALFVFLYHANYPLDELRTIMFAAVSIDSMFFAFSLKNLKEPIWKINLFSNYYLIFSLVISFLLLAGALFIPILRNLLSLVPLTGNELWFVLGIGLFNLLTIETAKHFFFKKKK